MTTARLPFWRVRRDAGVTAHATKRLALVAAVAAVLVGMGAVPAAAAPADDSADVGFIRDMSVHHAQAVQMANIIRDRTEDPALLLLAQDIATTQQGQIGRMSGWLDVWGLRISSTQPRMGWMHGGVAVDPMPGMATSAEVAELQTLPVPEAEIRFFQLMIAHHQGGVDMAEAELELGDQQLVLDLAAKIVETQKAEVTLMTDMLAERGAAPLPAPENIDAMTDGHSHGSSSADKPSPSERAAAAAATAEDDGTPVAVIALAAVGGALAGAFATILATSRRRHPAVDTGDTSGTDPV